MAGNMMMQPQHRQHSHSLETVPILGAPWPATTAYLLGYSEGDPRFPAALSAPRRSDRAEKPAPKWGPGTAARRAQEVADFAAFEIIRPQQMMMANGVYGAYPQMMMAQAPMQHQAAMLQHQAAMNGASFAAAQFYPQGQSFAGNGMVPGHMAGAHFAQQQQMMLYAMDQSGMGQPGGPPFWHMQGPPSPSHGPVMTGSGPPMAHGGMLPPQVPTGGAANPPYAAMRQPEAAAMM